jgi:ABC-type nitrate/sulfonate/bicarbonate transport system substrate-binding protein
MENCFVTHNGLKSWRAVTVAAFGLTLMTCSALAEPVKIRLGIGSAVEEQLWLILVKPEIAPNYGKVYTLDHNRFRSSSKRVQAFEAGALDVITTSANGAIFAASGGVDFKFVASISRESSEGFYTKFMVKADSPIKSVKDLKGRVIGINGFNGSGHLWTKIVLEKNGLTEKDVTLTPVQFPAQGQALKAGTIAVGMFPQPFADMIEKDIGARTIYSSKDAAPFSEELMVLVAKHDYIKANRNAVDALVSDLEVATKFYADNTTKARQMLIDGKMVRTPAAVYLSMKDYYRDPSVKVDLAALEKMQELQMGAGFQKKQVNLKCRVDWSCAGK